MRVRFLLLAALVAAMVLPAAAEASIWNADGYSYDRVWQAGPSPFPEAAGSPGTYFSAQCPAGTYVVGFRGRSGSWIDQLAPICDIVLGTRDLTQLGSNPYGGGGGGEFAPQICPRGAVLRWLGFDEAQASVGQYVVDNISASCFDPLAQHETVTSQGSLDGINIWTEGGAPVTDFPRQEECRDGDLATGIRGRADAYVFELGLICGPPPAVGRALDSVERNQDRSRRFRCFVR
ncbi:MAG: hypothetical protein WDM84_09050 [Bauldia sp.]